MEKKNTVITIIVAALSVILIVTGIYFKKDVKDADRFIKEYNKVSTDNVFVYKSAEDVIKLMEHGTGVVYLGFPECPWCQAYVRYLNEVAIDAGVDEIYYYNIKKDRDKNTDNYKKMVSILKNHTLYDEKGDLRIYVPYVALFIEGKIIGVDYETAFDTNGFNDPDLYWTDEEITELKDKLYELMLQVKSYKSSCSNCN